MLDEGGRAYLAWGLALIILSVVSLALVVAARKNPRQTDHSRP